MKHVSGITETAASAAVSFLGEARVSVERAALN
jgi:hypothetical protein